jgi:hypothetical protein
MQVVLNKQFLHGSSVHTCKWFLIKNDNSVKVKSKEAGKRQRLPAGMLMIGLFVLRRYRGLKVVCRG